MSKNIFNTSYRSHTCGELRKSNEGLEVKLCGWINRKRDHGNLIFIDLRDHYGITQLVIESDSEFFKTAESLRNEYVIQIIGKIRPRSEETINKDVPTGEIEIYVDSLNILSESIELPLQVNSDKEFPEETRLRYRQLDLRRNKLHKNIVLRCNVIASIRKRMIEKGFLEISTPILTASSPEGARDYLVPSRIHPGKFYALPQAPQQFKQLLMVAGFDKYFQIAPCFRDEDARADRSPGEFYQLDFEMSFVTQDDVFNTLEPVLTGVFEEFSDLKVTKPPYPRISFDESMLKYGTDKPDLRNPIKIIDVKGIFEQSNFQAFLKTIKEGGVVRAIPAPKAGSKPRSFFEKLDSFAKELGLPGLGYIIFEEKIKGPIAKFLSEKELLDLKDISDCENGDALFFVCSNKKEAEKASGILRKTIGEMLDIIEKDVYKFCWITDFPMYELTDEGKIDFSHNPFSMPQGGLDALMNKDPLEIKAYQYDIVCNGFELSSGAIRNHVPEIMYKAFEIAGYTKQDVDVRFGGMIEAFKLGAPPHGGSAPGIDRIVMLLANEPNIREIIAFPFNQQAQDLLMRAPNEIDPIRLKELHIKLDVKALK